MKTRVLLTMAILAALGLRPAWAQNVKITTPESMREPRVVTPGLLYEKRPSDDLYYLGIPPSVRSGLRRTDRAPGRDPGHHQAHRPLGLVVAESAGRIVRYRPE